MTRTNNMRSKPLAWWKKATDHQIYPRSFNDTNQDAIGDIRTIMDSMSNHASDEHPWFIKSQENNDSFKYVWRNGCKDALNSIYGKALKNVSLFLNRGVICE
ncbi:alpha-amylase family glycosyl hydrolase [Vibrio astriarenae]